MMSMEDMKKMDAAALNKQVFLFKKELFDLRLSVGSTHVKDNSQFKKLRAGIARALTLLKEKELIGQADG